MWTLFRQLFFSLDFFQGVFLEANSHELLNEKARLPGGLFEAPEN